MYSKEDLEYIEKIKFANIDDTPIANLYMNYTITERRNTKELETLKFICFRKLFSEIRNLPDTDNYVLVCNYLKGLKDKDVICDTLLFFISSLIANYLENGIIKYRLQDIIFKYGYDYLAERICKECPKKTNCVYSFCADFLSIFSKFEGNLLINNNIVECYDFRKIRPFLLKNFFGGKVENNSLDYDKILSYVVGNIISTMAEIRKFDYVISPDIIFAKKNLYNEYRKINKKRYTVDNIMLLKNKEREIIGILNLNNIRFFDEPPRIYRVQDISGFLKVFYTLCDGNTDTFDDLAKVFAEIFLGREFLNKEFENNKKLKPNNIVVLKANNASFVESFMLDIFNFFPEELNLKGMRNIPVVTKENPKGLGFKGIDKYNNIISIDNLNFKLQNEHQGLICVFGKNFIKSNTKFYPTNYSVYTLDELCRREKIGRFIENKIYGCIVNITILTGENDKSANLSQLKKMAEGKEVVYQNYYLGNQYYKSNLKYVFIAKNSQDFSILNENNINYTVINLSQNLPAKEYVNTHFLSTEEKKIIYNNFIRYGFNLLYCDKDVNKKEYTDYTFEELIKLFFEKCCEQVDYNKSNDKPTEFNATALKTLNCGFRLFCDILGEHLTVDKLNKKIIERYKLNVKAVDKTKSPSIVDRDMDKGFTTEELFEKKSGGTHWIGVIIKSKNEIKIIANELKNRKNVDAQKKKIPEFIDYIIDKLKINISTCSNQKAEIVIPEKTLQKALNEVQKAIVETKKASTSTSL